MWACFDKVYGFIIICLKEVFISLDYIFFQISPNLNLVKKLCPYGLNLSPTGLEFISDFKQPTH